MPTYKFRCNKCNRGWEERQNLILDGKRHVSICSSCQEEYNSVSFGGTGTLLKGAHMNKYLEGFPDQTTKLNKEADESAVRDEKEYNAFMAEKAKKENL